MKRWVSGTLIALVSLGVGASGMNIYHEIHDHNLKSQKEVTNYSKYSDVQYPDTSKSLPSKGQVADRLAADLDKFIVEHREGLIKTGSPEDIREGFEDTYVEKYQHELEGNHPSEVIEDKVESLIDWGLLTLHFDEKVGNAR